MVLIFFKIRRIQNPTLYQMYVTQKKSVAKKWNMGEDEMEKVLWHGTSEETVNKIVQGKFDRGFATTANSKSMMFILVIIIRHQELLAVGLSQL